MLPLGKTPHNSSVPNSHIIVGAGLPSPAQFNNVLWPSIAVIEEINEGGGSVKSDII